MMINIFMCSVTKFYDPCFDFFSRFPLWKSKITCSLYIGIPNIWIILLDFLFGQPFKDSIIDFVQPLIDDGSEVQLLGNIFNRLSGTLIPTNVNGGYWSVSKIQGQSASRFKHFALYALNKKDSPAFGGVLNYPSG